jgi:hypothetical protein
MPSGHVWSLPLKRRESAALAPLTLHEQDWLNRMVKPNDRS